MIDREFDSLYKPIIKPATSGKRQNQPNHIKPCNCGAPSLSGIHPKLLNRAMAASPSQGQQLLFQLQREYGNRQTTRVLDLSRKGEGNADVSSEVEQTISSKRGGGQALDRNVRTQMESAFGANFNGVRVHTDGVSDGLNQQLNARAFTTGQDIFFRQGSYNPGSSSGRELLAHELTHVVQQTGGLHTKMTVGQPGDSYEQEADEAARAVMRKEHKTTPGGSEQQQLYRQPEAEEEEELQAKLKDGVLQRQNEEEPEEEAVQTKAESESINRQEGEEVEEEQMPLATKREPFEMNSTAEK
jgi:hypothetical protein